MACHGFHSVSRATNVTLQPHKVSRTERSAILGRYPGFRGCTVWLTGLSGAGKTTIAFEAEKILVEMGIPVRALDGDNVRHGLCKNLGFIKEDREENVRRVAESAKLFADTGLVCFASFISPHASGRNEARIIHKKEGLPFFEVFVDTSLEVCEWRDTKNLYRKARAGEICGFTGVDGVYEEPRHPDLTIDAGHESAEKSTRRLITFLFEKGVLPYLPHSSAAPQSPINPLTTVGVSEVEANWIQVLSKGWLDPLRGLMTERQYLQCIHYGILLEPTPVAMRIPIAVKLKSQIMSSKPVVLACNNHIIATVTRPEIYESVDGAESLLGGDFLLHSHTNLLIRAPSEVRSELLTTCPDVIAAIFLQTAIDNNHAVLIDEARDLLKSLGYGNSAVAVFVNDEAAFIRSEGVADPETTRVVFFPLTVNDLLLQARIAKAIGATILLYGGRKNEERSLRIAPGLEDIEFVNILAE